MPVSSAAASVLTGNPIVDQATKIVATLGPASSDAQVIESMIRAGLDVVRLNFSHGNAQDHIARAQRVREASRRVGREVAIMADLQGPKIRVGKFAQGKVQLREGAPFILDAARQEPGDEHAVGLDYKELPGDVKAGDVLLLNDGLIVLDVQRVAGDAVHTVVRVGGELSDNKGINKQGGGLTAAALTAKDMEDIKTAIGLQADYVAVSFPKSGTDMEMARQLCNVAAAGQRHRPGLIAKIERAEAIANLKEILLASDGIMVARGDLAVEVGHAAVPALQKRMIRLAREHDRLIITATQMMESMINNPVPTRAEVSDVANAVLDGTDAVMLSAETAAGRYPLETVQAMASVCEEAEKHMAASDHEYDGSHSHLPRIDQAIAASALHAAQDGAVPQRHSHADGHQRRPRRSPAPSRELPAAPRRDEPGRHLRHHLRRADGRARRHQHAQDQPRGIEAPGGAREANFALLFIARCLGRMGANGIFMPIKFALLFDETCLPARAAAGPARRR